MSSHLIIHRQRKIVYLLRAVLMIVLLSSNEVYAQMPSFSQYFASPLYLNPALAGISVGPRVSLNYRNQWPSLGDGFNGGFSTYAASFDMHIEKIRGGIGVYMIGDQISNGILGTHGVSLMYSFQARIKKKVGIKIGLEGTYINRRLNFSKLLLYDMIDPYTGFYNNIDVPNPTNENVPAAVSTHRGDAGAGLVVFTDKMFFGASVKNLIGADESFTGIKYRQPIRVSAHFGYTFRFQTSAAKRHNIYLSPGVLFEYQHLDYMLNGGAIAGVNMAYFGAFFRHAINNTDAVIGTVGIRKGRFRVGYSYDYTLGPLSGRTGGAHELSFTFNWSGDDNSLNPKRNSAYIACPEILNF